MVSFNIQFLGLSGERRDIDLADMLASYDLIFVQELVAPPVDGTFPDGSPYRPKAEAKRFFDTMSKRGFRFVLSEEDTGTSAAIHNNGSATEWFAAFYKPRVVETAGGLPSGFLAMDRSHNPDFDRVPSAFAFRAGSADLVFISVHLRQGSRPVDRARRTHELETIGKWIHGRRGSERDYVVLGDMNFQNCAERDADIPRGDVALDARNSARPQMSAATNRSTRSFTTRPHPDVKSQSVVG